MRIGAGTIAGRSVSASGRGGLACLSMGLLFASGAVPLAAGCGGADGVDDVEDDVGVGTHELTGFAGAVSSTLQDDATGKAYLSGWACQLGSAKPITVSLYAKDTLLGSYPANNPAFSASEAATLKTKCATTSFSSVRFKILLSRSDRLEHFGEALTVRVSGQVLPGTAHRMPGLNPNAPMNIPQVWFGPLPPSPASPGGLGQHDDTVGGQFLALFPAKGQAVSWPTSLSKLTGLQLFGSCLEDKTPWGSVDNAKALTDAQLVGVVDFLRRNKVALAVEMPVVQNPAIAIAPGIHPGIKSPEKGRYHIERLQKIVGMVNAPAGSGPVASLDYVTLDEGFTHLAINPATKIMTIDQVALHVAYTVTQVESLFPSAKVGLVEWVHVYVGTGLTSQMYKDIIQAYRSKVGKYPAFFHLDMDHPPSTTSPAWKLEVQVARDVQAYCITKGIKFGMIYNSEKNSGTNSDWTNDALAMARSYESGGSPPNRAIFESWFQHPTAYIPETFQGTFTNLLLKY